VPFGVILGALRLPTDPAHPARLPVPFLSTRSDGPHLGHQPFSRLVVGAQRSHGQIGYLGAGCPWFGHPHANRRLHCPWDSTESCSRSHGASEGHKRGPPRGIKDSPPYLHDGRLLTLEDTVEFFNLVLTLKLKPQEKADLTAFLRAL